jgi:hypothetical protein
MQENQQKLEISDEVRAQVLKEWHTELARKAGTANAEKHGSEHMSKIGTAGINKRWDAYRKRKEEEAKND